MDEIFLLVGELGLPIAGCIAAGAFIYIILKYILSGVTDQVKTMHGIISMLDNRIKNMNNDMRKQKLKSRGNMNLRNFLEYSPSSVLKTAGDVTTIKEVIIPKRRAFNNNPNSLYMACR